MACMHNLHLMTPQGHLVHLALVHGQSLHICGKIIKNSNYLLFFLPYILDLLDITSQRKLAHIQRFILLNYHFNSITDIPVGTCPLAICDQSVLPVPKLFYFIFIFFQNTVVSRQLGKIPVLVSRTKIYHCTTHTWTQMTIWHVEPHCDGRQV